MLSALNSQLDGKHLKLFYSLSDIRLKPSNCWQVITYSGEIKGF